MGTFEAKHMSKTRNLVGLSLAAVSLSAVVFFKASHAQVNCTTHYSEQVNATECDERASNESWFAWLTGKSRNAQFHYLDLLELLTPSDNKQTPNRPTGF